MDYDGYNLLNIRKERGVAFATIDNPPINLLTIELAMELGRFAQEVAQDDDVRAVVFDSANPDYFIAHFDLNALAQFPDEAPPKTKELGGLSPIHEMFRTMPKATIAKIEGRARGGGCEFLLCLDMRFGALGKAIFGQPEVGVGILPGGGGTQRLPRLIGRSRALEIILGGDDITAEVAERYGLINRALPPDELTSFVNDLAFRIASFPAEAIALNKQSTLNALEMPLIEGLLEESYLFGQLAASSTAKELYKKALEAGAQTYEGELEFVKLYEKLQ
jgi:enoyl-CoA hydratase/carnithine racemase